MRKFVYKIYLFCDMWFCMTILKKIFIKTRVSNIMNFQCKIVHFFQKEALINESIVLIELIKNFILLYYSRTSNLINIIYVKFSCAIVRNRMQKCFTKEKKKAVPYLLLKSCIFIQNFYRYNAYYHPLKYWKNSVVFT